MAKKKTTAKKAKAPAKKKATKKKVASGTQKTEQPAQSRKSKMIADIESTVAASFGKGVVSTLSKRPPTNVTGVSWGAPTLNYICTGNPYVGLAAGRIYELFGPESSGKTTAAIHAVASAQADGLPVAFVDAEHALDLEYAQTLGVDPANLLFSQPDYGEQGQDLVESYVKAGVRLVVVDSVAALVPLAIIEASSEKHPMGVHARMMSQSLSKLAGTVSKSNACVLYINQTRMKIGEMFGCFHADTPVIFADGSQHEISKVVKEKIDKPVLSYDFQKGRYVAKKILNWYANGKLDKDEKWFTITTESAGGISGRMSFTCTMQHKLYCMSAGHIREVDAGNIKAGDKLVSWYEKKFTQTHVVNDVVEGSLLGDGCLRQRNQTAAFSLANQEQPEYLQWKLNVLRCLNFRKAGNDRRPRWDSEYRKEFALLRGRFYFDSRTGYRVPPENLRFNARSLAVFYMDDGHYKKSHRSAYISVKRLFAINRPDYARQIANAIGIFIGSGDNVYVAESQKAIVITTAGFAKLSRLVREFVPQCMGYKLNPEDRGFYDPTHYSMDTAALESKLLPLPVQVVSAHPASNRKYRTKDKYDLQIEDNANYLVGGSYRGVMVHNSPETTTGGNALRFYASCRVRTFLSTSSKQAIKGANNSLTGKKEKERLGSKLTARCVKNKLYRPFLDTEIPLYYGAGLDLTLDTFEYAALRGYIGKTTQSYVLGSKKIPFRELEPHIDEVWAIIDKNERG